MNFFSNTIVHCCFVQVSNYSKCSYSYYTFFSYWNRSTILLGFFFGVDIRKFLNCCEIIVPFVFSNTMQRWESNRWETRSAACVSSYLASRRLESNQRKTALFIILIVWRLLTNSMKTISWVQDKLLITFLICKERAKLKECPRRLFLSVNLLTAGQGWTLHESVRFSRLFVF